MAQALELAARGQGFVEPNPMVGCLIVRGDDVVGEGWHRRYGGPHAEVHALRAAGAAAADATAYVTLEPCCHLGKTPPCSQALIDAGVARVVVAHRDPFPQVDGGGIRQLQQAGIDVTVGVLERQACWLNAPFLKRVRTGQPWVIAKWAMTLDGKIGTHAGSSRWISNEMSRIRVHQLRGRVDGIMVGQRTAALDNPMLTARPPGPRTAMRIVVDSRAGLQADSQLVRSATDIQTLIAAGPDVPTENRSRLEQAGCEVWTAASADPQQRLLELLSALGERGLTNVLVEGGGRLLGSLFDARAIDEVHVFIASKLVGGLDAPSPLAGRGLASMADATALHSAVIEPLDGDVYIHGRIRSEAPADEDIPGGAE
jgi:diaminohydroxyphosphoribosylaminopyrimidine deaminase/5-amino-6-(5-phosphoribosylamino)uracil reductase